MNRANRNSQSSQSCKYCGKSYVKKTNLEKHIILCELLNTCKTKSTIEEDEEIPSQRKMYKILLELGNRFTQLEEKVDGLNKWVVKKKKKINVIEWLNTHFVPEISFTYLIEKIIIYPDDVSYLFENTFADTLNHIFSRNIYNMSEESEETNPIYAFVQKTNIFYIYENKDIGWIELDRDNLTKFLNKVHMKLLRKFIDWKRENKERINDDEKLAILCDKTSVKMMNVDFRQESILGKIRANMYSRMKKDMQALVEYEFEF